MLVTDTETFLLHDRFVLVRLATTDGLVGWGATTYHPGGQPYGGRLLAAAVDAVAAELRGRDPLPITAWWHETFERGWRLGSTGVHLCALSAVDVALHDLKGRALDVGVCDLLGGRGRDDVPVYASLVRRGLPPAENVERVQALREAGFGAVKLHTGVRMARGRPTGTPDDTVATVDAIRDRVGDADVVGLLIDVNSAYDRLGALRVGRALGERGVGHFEEPLAPWDLDGYRELVERLEVPVAAGEQLGNPWQFADLVERGRVDVVQPDVTTSGGFTALVRIAALAARHARPLVAHNVDRSLGTAAHLHAWAAVDGFDRAQELPAEPSHPLVDDTPVLAEPLVAVEGRLRVPGGPGLGVTVDEEVVRAAAQAW